MLLITTIFLASLLGSLHCAGMCGAFLAIAIGNAPSRAPQIAYHLGRLVTYTALGALAGSIGKLVNLAGALAHIQPLALSIAAIITITFGVNSLLTTLGYSSMRFQAPRFMSSLAMIGHRSALQHGPIVRGALIGLVTTLLPCGWLYAFVAAAAGTGSASRGALTMAVFWSGTIPVMASLGLGLRGLLGAAGKRIPVITCLALIAVGSVTLAGRNHLNINALATSADQSAKTETIASAKPSCCEVNHAHTN